MRKGPILLVDDEPVVLQVHAAAVKHFGFETIIAENAEEGIGYVRSYRPAMVISDVQMPGDGGFDFISSLDRAGLKSMPVVFLTGYNDIDIVRGGLKAGGDDFIIKGGSIERLRNRIAFWMAGGFTELPSEVRRRALTEANAETGDEIDNVEQHLKLSQSTIEQVGERMQEEVAAMPSTYGKRLVERVCFLGRLSKVILEESRGFGDLVRFPDYVIKINQSLDMPWSKEIWPLLKRFDDWSCDTRFVLAGMEPLKQFFEYDWYMEGLE